MRAPPAGSGRWVLVTDGADNGQSRSSLAAVRALSAGGYSVAVTISGRHSLAAASRGCRRVVRVPPGVSTAYADAIAQELASREYLTVLPASDAALVALALPGHELIGKDVLAQRAAEVGLAAVPSQYFADDAELRAAGGRLDYPVVVKPTLSRVPARRVNGPADLDTPSGAGPYLVQPYLDGTMSAVSGVIRRGRLIAAVHQRYLRTWPVACGTSCAAVTTEPDAALEAALARLLTGYEGIFQAQFRAGYVIDLNLRVYGSLPLAVASGVNLAGLHCAVVAGEDPPLQRARPGVGYRWVEGDLRHAAAQVRVHATPMWTACSALRPRRGTAHSVLSMRDPAPALSRLRYAFSAAVRR